MKSNTTKPYTENRRMGIVLALLAAVGLVFCACSSGSQEQKEEVIEAVKRYNGFLRRTYMEADSGLMASVTTEKQLAKIIPTVIALRAANSFMMAEQTSFEVRKVSVKGESATLESEEGWHYWWQDKDTLEITKPEENIVYKIRYVLVRKDGEWMVDALEDIE